MVVTIAGIKRSASTACYNIARISLEEAGYKINIHGQEYDPQDVPEGQVSLVKIHPFKKELAQKADHIFVTDRCDNDILESLNRMWDSGNAQRLSRMRGQLAKWMLYTDPEYYFYYRGNIGGWIERIVDLLGVEADIEVVRQKFEAIEPPENKQDPVTLLFPNHISE